MPLNMKNVSKRSTKDFSIRRIKVHDFILSTEHFINENFRGALDFNYSGILSGFIDVAPCVFAQFLRTLIWEIHGNDLLRANVECSETEIRILVNYGSVPLKDELFKLGECFCFEMERFDEFSIILRADIMHEKILKVYNPTVSNFEAYLYEMFYI